MTAESMTRMTPFDWNTFRIVINEVPPFSSFSMMSWPSCREAQSLPPSTVVSSAVPLPSLDLLL
jgi:hypothetical protein